MSTPYQRAAPNANGDRSSSSSSMMHSQHHHQDHRHSHHHPHYAGSYESSQRHNVSYPGTTSYRPPPQQPQQHHHRRDRGVVVPLHDTDRLRYPISSARLRNETVVSSGSTSGTGVGGGTSSGGGPRYNVRDSSLKRRLFHDSVDNTATTTTTAAAATTTTNSSNNVSPHVPSPAAAAAAAEAAASSSTPMLRAAPFEPLVHERNLPYSGTISTMRYSRYYHSDQHPGNEPHPPPHHQQSRYHHQHHRPDHHGPPRQQSSWDQNHAAPNHYHHPQDYQRADIQRAAFEPPMDDSGELRWKRRCYQLQRELNETRDSLNNLKEEHQRLKRRYTKLEESWILSTQRSNTTSNARNSADTFNTGHCVHHRNKKKKRRVTHDESSPASARAASGSNNNDDGEEREPDTESKILAIAAKAVTEDIGYGDDEDDEEEVKLPALVKIPLRADGQIVCHADDEALSDDEGEVDAISLEEMDSESSFVQNHLRNKRKEDAKDITKSKESKHHQQSNHLVDDSNAHALAAKPPDTGATARTKTASRGLQGQDVDTSTDTVSLNKTKSDDSTSLVAV